MLRHRFLAAAAAACLFAGACESGRRSPAGFRLAANGDVGRGREVFQEFQCHSCHEVAGQDLPKPTADPPVPVVLGGTVIREKTDGYLVTAIINPDHGITGRPASLVLAANHSRMPDYSERLTVRQLTDLVEFLQSTYRVRAPENHRFGY